METLQTIETKVTKLIEQNQKDITEAEEELIKTGQVILEAQAELLQAQREINAQKYTEAKTKLWTAEQTKELYEKQLETISNQPVISYEEYHEIIGDITKLANKEQEDCYTQACEKLKEVVAIANIAVEKANKTDQLLKKIEGQLTKNSESYKKNKTGAYLFYSGIGYNPQRALYKHKEQLERIIDNFSK
ncbi:hypothetical protein [Streptococcus oralis]|uniref:hypothetical protein n=1 Tax=Streptococcus oralis TaxID=1303 RepID=UPI00356A5D3C